MVAQRAAPRYRGGPAAASYQLSRLPPRIPWRRRAGHPAPPPHGLIRCWGGRTKPPAGFPKEAIATHAIVRHGGQKHLGHHRAVEPQLPCEIDRTHAAAAKQPFDMVARPSARERSVVPAASARRERLPRWRAIRAMQSAAVGSLPQRPVVSTPACNTPSSGAKGTPSSVATSGATSVRSMTGSTIPCRMPAPQATNPVRISGISVGK